MGGERCGIWKWSIKQMYRSTQDENIICTREGEMWEILNEKFQRVKGNHPKLGD